MDNEVQLKRFPGRSLHKKMTLKHCTIGLNEIFWVPVLHELILYNIQERSDVTVFNTNKNKGHY